MKKFLKYLIATIAALFIIVCSLLYFNQEKVIFFPHKLESSFTFNFENNFEEMFIETNDGTLLNGLLFKSDSSIGLIFYLHGNAGALDSWGDVAKTYLDLNYDVFILDYRGFGKSGGNINSEEQFFQDVQIAYNELKKNYSEDKIVVLGYSIGTGVAAKIASTNNPKMLILQAPYFSLTDMMNHFYPIVPTFLLKYKFETYAYLKECHMPVVIFHGDQDEVIYYESSLKLQKFFKAQDTLITLYGQGHNGMTFNPDYKIELILKD